LKKEKELKNMSFRELIVASSLANTQKELDKVYDELSVRPFWMKGSIV